MAGKIKLKHVYKTFAKRPSYRFVSNAEPVVEEKKKASDEAKPKKNASSNSNKDEDKTDAVMLTNEQLEQIEATAENLKQNVKVIKKEKGLIERTESSKIVLTEDNRQVLND